MAYALVYYLNINTERINKFRHKYDPQVDLIEQKGGTGIKVPEFIGEPVTCVFSPVVRTGMDLGGYRTF